MTHTKSMAIPDSGALGPPEPTLREAVALMEDAVAMLEDAYPILAGEGHPLSVDILAFTERVDAAAWATKEIERSR